MNAIGDENSLLIFFGICTVVVLAMAIRLRARRYAVAASAAVGLLCGLAIYAVVAALMLLVGGTSGFQVATWLVMAAAGAIAAGLIGLVQGLIASVIVRQFHRTSQ